MVEIKKLLGIYQLKRLQWNKIFNMFYVEPFVFILVFAHSISGTILRNEMIYQTCTAIFNYNVSDCLQLGTNNLSDHAKKIETELQPYVANLFMIRTLLESIVPAICGVFIGSWSDHYGRKPLLKISIIGFSFTYVIAVIICELSRYYIVNPWYYILAVLPHSLLGGNCVFSVAVFCYVTDVTTTKTRPYRMIMVEVMFFVGLMIGSLLSSFIYAATNATITFGISGLIMFAATILVFQVPESLNYKINCNSTEQNNCESEAAVTNHVENHTNNEMKMTNIPTVTLTATTPNDINNTQTNNLATSQNCEQSNNNDESSGVQTQNQKENQNQQHPNQQDQNECKEGNVTNSKAALFSYIHIKDMIKTCFKTRPYYDRCIIWLVTGVMFISIFVIDGILTVFYLFVREKFHWNIREYTMYETFSYLIPMLGSIFGVLILRKCFNVSIVTLAALSYSAELISSLIKGLASEPWHLYLSVMVGAFKPIGGPMCRTIVSNIVPSNDLGKIFSIKNILQTVAPFLAAPLYALVYQNSLRTFPGLFNIMSAALYAIAFIFIMIVLRFKYRYKEHYSTILN